jgi:hypothetical protein
VRHRTPARRALLREADYDPWLDGSVDKAPGFFTTFGSGDFQGRAVPIGLVRKGNSVPQLV